MSRRKALKISLYTKAREPLALFRRQMKSLDRKRLIRCREIRIPITAPLGPSKGAHAGRHLQLKLSAAAFLAAQGKPDVRFEVNVGGLVIDVASEYRRVAVECGQTQIDKLFCLAEDGVATIWLPYGSYELGDLAVAYLATSLRPRVMNKNSAEALEQRRILHEKFDAHFNAIIDKKGPKAELQTWRDLRDAKHPPPTDYSLGYFRMTVAP